MTLHPVHAARRTSARVVFFVLRLLPRASRFRAARIIALCAGRPVDLLAPLLQRSRRSATREEKFLSYLLGGMDERQLLFDPDIEVSGFEELKAAAQDGRGVVLIGVHANAGLCRLLLRVLYDARLPFVAMSHAAEYPISGVGTAAETLRPSGAFLLNVRSKLRSGSLVCALIDFPDRIADATHVVINGVSVWLSTPLLDVALQWQVPIAFFRGTLKGRSVAIEIEPCSSTATAGEAIEAITVFLSAAIPTQRAKSQR